MDVKLLGLIGKSLKHSFSKKWFSQKFENEGISNYLYCNFELDSIESFPEFLKSNLNLVGFNVTIPYKESIISYLDDLSNEARLVGAVNCVLVEPGSQKTIGHNTDVYGFASSIKPFVEPKHERALILGNGGAAKAVKFALQNLGIKVLIVTRNPKNENEISYQEVTDNLLKHFLLVVNTTPLGTFPDILEMPPINLNGITKEHIVYDLIYNPSKTLFLQTAEEKGATVFNGYDMLKLQAEKAWQLFKNQ